LSGGAALLSLEQDQYGPEISPLQLLLSRTSRAFIY
jgi:hypothetical protein